MIELQKRIGKTEANEAKRKGFCDKHAESKADALVMSLKRDLSDYTTYGPEVNRGKDALKRIMAAVDYMELKSKEVQQLS